MALQKKIDKRGRKLVDYDSQRHSFQSLQANAAKRKDDVKVRLGSCRLCTVAQLRPTIAGHKGTRNAGGGKADVRGAERGTARRAAGPARLENTVPGDEPADAVRLRAAVPQRNVQGVRRAGGDRRQARHRVPAGLVHAQKDHR